MTDFQNQLASAGLVASMIYIVLSFIAPITDLSLIVMLVNMCIFLVCMILLMFQPNFKRYQINEDLLDDEFMNDKL